MKRITKLIAAFMGALLITTVIGCDTATMDDSKNENSEQGENSDTEVTSNIDKVIADIKGLTGEGPHDITVTGKITNDDISKIKNTMEEIKKGVKINLDLSKTTGLTSIDNGAFEECINLISILIPDSVTSIGYSAFDNCNSLTSVIIPASVTSIKKRAFSYCDNLTSLIVDENNETYKSINNCVLTKDGKTLVASATNFANITIPDSVTSISEDALSGNKSLTSITIPDSVISIDKWAFATCENLTSMTIGSGIAFVKEGAFNGCSSLTEIHYKGTEAQWNEIRIDSSNNDELTKSTIIFES